MAGDPLPDKGVRTPTLSSVLLLSVRGWCEGWEKSAEARQRLVRTAKIMPSFSTLTFMYLL